MRSFDVCSYGILPAPDLGKFGLKHWCFKELFYYWTWATLDDGDNEDRQNPIGQHIKRYNDLMIPTRITLSMGERLRSMNGYYGTGQLINQ